MRQKRFWLCVVALLCALEGAWMALPVESLAVPAWAPEIRGRLQPLPLSGGSPAQRHWMAFSLGWIPDAG